MGRCGREGGWEGANRLTGALTFCSRGWNHSSFAPTGQTTSGLPQRVSQALLYSSFKRSNHFPSIRGAKTPAALTHRDPAAGYPNFRHPRTSTHLHAPGRPVRRTFNLDKPCDSLARCPASQEASAMPQNASANRGPSIDWMMTMALNDWSALVDPIPARNVTPSRDFLPQTHNQDLAIPIAMAHTRAQTAAQRALPSSASNYQGNRPSASSHAKVVRRSA
ncbi:hypothetical protein VTK26DRAFT_8872 [Humicola hyalothermophila]